ncbi:beta-glucosidase family protein [Agrococcus jejuensis]|uniref:Beta-glucosidase n=1 Tax=Agrococcus jejuensis TaxID=399736 RepID=A0A1G8C819_9MICO|nr:glycoside hydrolase family 3 C-terminal domain-containing protein [Agrococcus jejuensis]SDH41453.1 beta-glucosidase [Agrococcus jejuensis]
MTPKPAAWSTALPQPHREPTDAWLDERIALLDLPTKVGLLTGETAWRLPAIPAIGLRGLTMSDGPVGVRGTGEVDGERSLLLPSPTALAAHFDPEIMDRVGRLIAAEARRKGVDVVLAPQVNLQRTPVGGRHFECLSEDPLLTSVLGAAFVAGIQAGGVAACIKHYVANDSETQRTEYVSDVDERTLREAYLPPFEAAVRAGAWAIMAAYNDVDDGTESAPMTEHRHLLRDVLRDEWGFDGIVVSDWLAASTTDETALGGLDVTMPGPGGPWGEALVAAVRAGRVPEEVVDAQVRNVLRVAARTGCFDGTSPVPPPADDRDRALVRASASGAVVVLRRPASGLPSIVGARSVALIGPNAVRPHVLGGGSSTVHPERIVTPEQGIVAALPDAEVHVRRGGSSRRFPDPMPQVDVPVPGGVVLHARLVGDGVDEPIAGPWEGWLHDIAEGVDHVELVGEALLAEPGTHVLQLGTVGRHRVEVDGVVVSESEQRASHEVVLDSSVNNPDGVQHAIEVDEPRTVTIRVMLDVIRAGGYGRFARGVLRHRPPSEQVETEIAEAVAAARDADVAIVVVGTTEESESEGWDRTTLALPGRQDELVTRILDVAPDAIVVVNAGAPVLLPWLDRARTVLWGWFGGQEWGGALADVLTGVAEPAGRLPWTLPASEADVPVPHAIPDAGLRVDYADGLDVGYRGWLRSGAVPAASFGHGLGWTDVAYRGASAGLDGDAIVVDVELAETAGRAGSEVVQAYLLADPSDPDDADRPVASLAGFARVQVAAGETVHATVRVETDALRRWDGGWRIPAGRVRLAIGGSLAAALDPATGTTVAIDHPGCAREQLAVGASALPGGAR